MTSKMLLKKEAKNVSIGTRIISALFEFTWYIAEGFAEEKVLRYIYYYHIGVKYVKLLQLLQIDT